MDFLMIVIYLFVIFLCFYSIYILNQMRNIVDKMTIDLSRMSEILKKNDEWKENNNIS